MSTLQPHQTEPHQTEAEAWQDVESFLVKLHDLSHAPLDTEAFLGELLAGSVATLAATGGAVWQQNARNRWEVVQQVDLDSHLDRRHPEVDEKHQVLLRKVANAEGPLILPPGDNSVFVGTEHTVALAAVPRRGEASHPLPNALRPFVVVELFLRDGSPGVHEGWKEFLTTVCHIAGIYQTEQELRALRSEKTGHGEILSLVRRIHAPLRAEEVGFEIANTGRNFLGADRVSVLRWRGHRWQLLATSGVDRIVPQADTVKRLEQLAQVTADWAEPVDYVEGQPSGEDTTSSAPLDVLPPAVAEVIERHVDESQARRLISVPIGKIAAPGDEHQRPQDHFAGVLIAESFSATGSSMSLQRTLELADLCEPALRHATKIDRFPVRTLLRWSDAWAELLHNWGVGRLAMVLALVLAVLAALIWVPTDFEVSATARLVPLVERDIFSTAQGTVAEILVEHGDLVAAGESLAVLHDPQLALETERVLGELETVRNRLETIAVTRTDRQVREETGRESMPLSAEAKQLELRLASLERQREILAARREALSVRSPIAGTVQTLDVQHLLRTRPVDRGQVLFTVADTTSGWKLQAEIPQDQVGHVLAAQQQRGEPLPVRFRLAGDARRQVYSGKLESLSGVAVLDTSGLEEELPHLRAEVSVDESSLPAARPGMDAEVRIACGRRALGFVWLHNVWDNIVRWVVF